ncbi:MAG: hypothetical protein PHX48_07445, partial [Bacteroidales bacterium]|nr:hypothetical protein [Bacteroidales bacterium]
MNKSNKNFASCQDASYKVAGCSMQGGRMYTTTCHLAKIKSIIKKLIPHSNKFISRFGKIRYHKKR